MVALCSMFGVSGTLKTEFSEAASFSYGLLRHKLRVYG